MLYTKKGLNPTQNKPEPEPWYLIEPLGSMCEDIYFNSQTRPIIICYGKKPNKSCLHHLAEFLLHDTIQKGTCLENLKLKKS